jgi:hypothetical protein
MHGYDRTNMKIFPVHYRMDECHSSLVARTSLPRPTNFTERACGLKYLSNKREENLRGVVYLLHSDSVRISGKH